MKTPAGFSLVELMVATAAVSGVILVSSNIYLQLKSGEKAAFDSLMQLAEQRLFAQIIRSDLRKVAPSFGVLKETPDSNSNVSGGNLGSFFDINRVLGCSEELDQCGRSYTIEAGSTKDTFYLLVDASEDGMGLSYDPSWAFQGSTYVSTNRNSVLINGADPIPGGFTNDALYLLTSMSEVPVNIGTQPQSQCQCIGSGGIFNCSSPPSSCGNTPPIPFSRNSSFVGVASGITSAGSTGDISRPSGTATTLFNQIFVSVHPADGNVTWGTSPEIFFKTLPGMGDIIARARIKKVQLLRYKLLPNKDLVRSTWSHYSQNKGFNPAQDLVIANKVKKVTFRRPSISVGTVTFSMQHER